MSKTEVMKSKKTNMRFIKVLIPFMLVAVIAMTVWASKQHGDWMKNRERSSLDSIADVQLDRMKDEEILNELASVYRQLDSVKTFYMKGIVNTTDPRDSSNVVNTVFAYHVKGAEMYCQLADQEMYASPEHFVTVNHGVKKIFLSGPKAMTMPFRISSDSLRNMVQGDGYKVTRTVINGTAVIRLLRETHINCKEYAVTFDPHTLRMKQVFMRLSDMDEPESAEKDKTITVRFDQWELEHVTEKMPAVYSWLKNKNGHVVPSAQLTGYEVIHMGNMN
ncbi:hypothetical protein CK934_07590 [Chitinophaga sp. MD30]|nr:hypothetical protein CK934_07590 [Chitinophaga sp. MD30]